MHNIHRVVTRAFELPWAILPSKLEDIKAFLLSRADLTDTADEGVKMRAEARQRFSVSGAIAVVNVFGTVTHRANMMTDFSGGTSTELLVKQVREAAAEPSISAIILQFDTPGGTVDGVPEAHAAIMDARSAKPIIASVNSMAASAGLWLASAASEKSITPSGSIGSLGVYSMHQDISAMAEKEGVKTTFISAGKYKTEGNRFEPLSEEARENIQAQVDAFYSMFVNDVAKGYGIASKDVKENFGQGRMLMAKDAKAAGMVDRIESLGETVARLSRVGTKGTRRAEMAAEDMKRKMDLSIG